MSERPEKYRGADAVILRHPELGVIRLDPKRFSDAAAKDARRAGWEPYESPEDGFRKRPRRTKADMERLIREGVVATEPQAHQEYGPETFVFELPLGSLGGEGKDAG